MEGNSTTEKEEQSLTMKPVYEFEWADGSVRRTDTLENDSRDFREEGIEALAERGRADPECEVTLVGFQQIQNT